MRLLIVNDEQRLGETLLDILREDGDEVTIAANGRGAMELFAGELHDIVIIDECLVDMSGMALMKKVRDLNPETEVIMITGFASLENAIAALRGGAYDYLLKSYDDLELVSQVVRRAKEKIMLVRQNRLLLEKLRMQNSELEEDRRSLLELAPVDMVTGLYDKNHFEERVETELRRSRRYGYPMTLVEVAVSFADNECGQGNDGNILKELGLLLRSKLRRTDLVARYQDDIFVLLLPETPRDGGATVCEKLTGVFRERCQELYKKFEVGEGTCRYGIAEFPGDGETVRALLEHAGEELRQKKT